MRHITFAANQGEIGGGEVMLLALAEAARDLGHEVEVVGPQSPGELVEAARARGFTTTAIPGRSARVYLANLRRWDLASRHGLLWCNGLRPALATAFHRERVVHLHQQPVGKLAVAARVARLRTLATVVPSEFMARRMKGGVALENWTAPVPHVAPKTFSAPVTLGYLGRLSSDKGVPVLCEAVRYLIDQGHDIRLVLAGEARFVDAEDSKRVDAAVAALGDRVARQGWMNRDDFFADVDLAVFPSVWEEPFGLVAAEAMSAGCPFIITDAGALPDIVGADYPFVASRGDARALREAITKALTADWSTLGPLSQERWEARFSPAAGRERLRAFLGTLPTPVENET